MKMRSFLSVLLLAVPLMAFVGCGKKKVVKTEKTTQTGKGLPLAGFKKGNKDYGKDVEAFVLDDADDSSLTMIKSDKQVTNVSYVEDKSNTKSFEPVYFDFDRFGIRADQEPVVEYDAKKAKHLTKTEGKVIRVEGNSDKHCISETYNLAVSQKRAHTVADRLAKEGVDRDLLKPVGYGDTKPALDLPGKVQENRRVEFVALTV